jgi:dipeptidyl aminopeptidase/acylaminoacyl peptidase
MRISADHRASLFLVEPSSGRSEFLAKGTAPRPSNDGRYLAYDRWDSIRRPWTLVVLDLTTKQEFVPNLDGCSSPHEWSPDGKWIAVMVTPCQERKSKLCFVAMPSGAVQWVDSLEVFSDYEFSWSPDSRCLVAARPTAMDEESEEPTASDLWIIGIDGHRCLLSSTPAYVEHDPQWIDGNSIRVDRSQLKNGEFVGADHVVLALRKE